MRLAQKLSLQRIPKKNCFVFACAISVNVVMFILFLEKRRNCAQCGQMLKNDVSEMQSVSALLSDTESPSFAAFVLTDVPPTSSPSAASPPTPPDVTHVYMPEPSLPLKLVDSHPPRSTSVEAALEVSSIAPVVAKLNPEQNVCEKCQSMCTSLSNDQQQQQPTLAQMSECYRNNKQLGGENFCHQAATRCADVYQICIDSPGNCLLVGCKCG